ncbi:MAG: AraC family transcriptional regulator [Pyrinomonadaceae bacterium]
MKSKKKGEKIKVWRLTDIDGIELRSGVAVKEPYPRHWHEEYQFCFIQAGGGELFYRGASHHTPRTSLFIVHPGEVHSNRTETGCSFRSLYIDSGMVGQITSEIAGRKRELPFFSRTMIFDEEIINEYLLLHLAEETRATTLERESAILEMLTGLIARYAPGGKGLRKTGRESRAVKQVRDYILAHYERNISLEELSHLTGLSRYHLSRVFAKEAGMPPHAFQTQVRISHAKKLIQAGHPLSDVAQSTGFADQSHFHRHFKRLMKVTPGEYL